jgi:hypothetical protein
MTSRAHHPRQLICYAKLDIASFVPLNEIEMHRAFPLQLRPTSLDAR